MAKGKEKEEAKANVQEMLNERPVGEKFSYSERKKIVMLESQMRLKAGKQYEIFYQKADYLISRGWAKEVK